MGQRTRGVDDSPEFLERDLAGEREHLGRVLSELDRRRHRMMDVKLQASEHSMALGIGAGVLLLVIGGIVALSIWRSRRAEKPAYKARHLREAMHRMVQHPEAVARHDAQPLRKALTAAATAASAATAKHLVERAFRAV